MSSTSVLPYFYLNDQNQQLYYKVNVVIRIYRLNSVTNPLTVLWFGSSPHLLHEEILEVQVGEL